MSFYARGCGWLQPGTVGASLKRGHRAARRADLIELQDRTTQLKAMGGPDALRGALDLAAEQSGQPHSYSEVGGSGRSVSSVFTF